MTAALLVPPALLGIFWLPPFWFAVLTALITAVAAYEWAHLAGYPGRLAGGFYVLLVLGLCALALYQPAITPAILIIGGIWWALAGASVLGYAYAKPLYQIRLVRLGVGVLVLVPAYLGLQYLRDQPDGGWLVFYVILMACMVDAGGYLVGSAFGRHKLVPSISPAKTLEGAVGGFTLSMLAAVVLGLLVLKPNNWLLFLGLSAFLTPISILGDLVESIMKRAQGVQDSSNLLPGHGGLLDLIDAIIAVAGVLALVNVLGVSLV